MATAPRSSASESLASSTNSTAPSSSSARTASLQSQSVASARPSVKATKEIASSSAVSPILPSSSSSLVSSEPASSTANVSASSRHRAPSPATPSSSTNVLNGGIQVNSANVSATSTPSSNATGSSTPEVSTSLSSSAASSARAISTSLPSSSSSHALSPSNINSASSPGSSSQANQSNIANAPVSTIFSTATDTPESTFSSPVSITLTGQNGSKSVSVPAVITSVTPSTSSDGTVVQITHIIANPNGNLNPLQHHSFFDNHGAVAGTFIAAGLVAAASLGVAFCMLRRRRRRERRRRLEAMLPSMPSNPFEDGQDGRQAMSQRSSAYHDFGVYDEPSPALRHPEQARINGNIESSGRGGNNMYEGPFSDYHSPGRDSFFDQDRVIDVRPASRQLSTPSIYPPSLPDSDEDSLYAKEVSSPLPLTQIASVSEYTPLERVGIRPSTQESQLSALNKEHPPLAPDMTMTRSLSVTSHTGSSSYGHSTVGGPSTPTSENTTIAASEEGIKGHPMLPSPPSAFLRRQLSKRTPMTIIVSQSSVTSPPQTPDSSIGYGTAM